MEILETTPIYAPYWWFILIMVIVGTWALGYIGICLFDHGFKGMGLIGHIFGFVMVVTFITFIVLGANGTFSYYRGDELTVRLDDTVSVVDIFKEYEIKGHEKYSNIYTLFKEAQNE